MKIVRLVFMIMAKLQSRQGDHATSLHTEEITIPMIGNTYNAINKILDFLYTKNQLKNEIINIKIVSNAHNNESVLHPIFFGKI